MGGGVLGESIRIRRGGGGRRGFDGSDGWRVRHCRVNVGVIGGPIASQSRCCLRGGGLHHGVAVCGRAEGRSREVLRRGGRGVGRWEEGAVTRRRCRRVRRGEGVAATAARVAVGAVASGIPAFAVGPDVSTALPIPCVAAARWE